MISLLEKKITLRYLKAKKSDGFLNIISTFSFIGISLGVAVLIIVMSVMNGFRTELTNKIIGFNAHVTVKFYDFTKEISHIKNKEIKKISKNIFESNSGEGVIMNKDYTKGILLKGYKSADFKKLKLVEQSKFNGSKNLDTNLISIGKELSSILNVNIGDKITIMSAASVDTIIGSLPIQDTFTIISIFDSGIVEFDQNVAFINLYDLENIFNQEKDDRYIEIFLKDPIRVKKFKNTIEDVFKSSFIYTWEDLNKSLFSALKVERNVMFIILSLIIIVAAFNIISGLTILVKNKTRDIAILKSIGVKNSSIKKIFFLVGLIIGVSATIFGILLGILFSYNIEEIRIFLSSILNINIFPEEIYFLSKMPAEINIKSIGIISLISIFITSLVSWYPANKAANLDTIKSLKYD